MSVGRVRQFEERFGSMVLRARMRNEVTCPCVSVAHVAPVSLLVDCFQPKVHRDAVAS